MDVVAELAACSEAVYHLVRYILRMRSHESDAFYPVYLIDCFYKVSKAVPFSVPVRIDILPQEHHLYDAVC